MPNLLDRAGAGQGLLEPEFALNSTWVEAWKSMPTLNLTDPTTEPVLIGVD